MIEKVQRYMEEHHMIDAGDRVVIGVSGGADSVCLLFVMLQIGRKYPLSLYVVHVNHGLRGDEAARDAAFVEGLCRENELPFYLYEEDVSAYAGEHGLSVEEAGRLLRYRAFSEVKELTGAQKIAVAHHKNDQAETVLFRLFRGTGVKGLGGMAPVMGEIIRPLLCTDREEIEQYLRGQGLSYCTDSTNLSDHYARNAIRNRLLPEIEKLQSRAVLHIADTAQMMQETEHYLYGQAQKEYETWVTEDQKGGYRVSVVRLGMCDPVIQQYLIRLLLEKLARKWKDIGVQHVRDILRLQEKEVGKTIILPQGLIARRDYDDIVICAANPTEKASKWSIRIDEFPALIHLPDGLKAEFTVANREKNEKIEQKTYTKQFDYDKIENSLLLRSRDTNDFFCINSGMDRQTIKTYCINEKIPREQREELVLLADGAHILWVVGYRISEKYKITEHTKRILKVHVYGGNVDE